jgi:hypothetical protein
MGEVRGPNPRWNPAFDLASHFALRDGPVRNSYLQPRLQLACDPLIPTNKSIRGSFIRSGVHVQRKSESPILSSSSLSLPLSQRAK